MASAASPSKPTPSNADEALAGINWTEGFPVPVQRRIRKLYEVQDEFSKLNMEYQKERLVLEAKYTKLYSPLFDQRREVVAGASTVGTYDLADDGTEDKGIEEFWLGCLSNLSEAGQFINDRDAEALKYLEDIRYEVLTGDDMGFKIVFHFKENPFFTNKTLEKTYILDDTEELVPKQFIGTKIDWKAGKNLTVEMKKKKATDKRLRGKAAAAVVTTEEPCDSFFNWFDPPEMPENPYDLEQSVLDALQEELTLDYDLGAALKERLIPRAIEWYTGEAVEDEYYDEGEGFEEGDQ